MDAEDAAFRVGAIGKPADAGNGHLRHHDLAAAGRDFSDGLFDGSDLHGIDCAGGAVLVPHDAAVDARLAIGTCGREPVILRAAPFLDLPSEYFLIELRGTLRILSADLEMHDSVHGRQYIGNLLIDLPIGRTDD